MVSGDAEKTVNFQYGAKTSTQWRVRFAKQEKTRNRSKVPTLEGMRHLTYHSDNESKRDHGDEGAADALNRFW